MRSPADVTGRAQGGELEVLDDDECWRLLASRTVGRLAVNRRGLGPLVVPIVYAVDEPRGIVFRSGVGTKLARITRGTVSFEVDHIDEERRLGWSVLVAGLAHEVDPDIGVAATIEPWIAGRLGHAVRIVPTSVSGRRLT